MMALFEVLQAWWWQFHGSVNGVRVLLAFMLMVAVRECVADVVDSGEKLLFLFQRRTCGRTNVIAAGVAWDVSERDS